MTNNEINKAFSLPLLNWFTEHGRKNLPWQHPNEAYRVWISEIMLQQTQVLTVIPYFERFITVFPDIKTLSEASEDAVLAQWSGLGYYSRARNIHKTAKIIWEKYRGKFPDELTTLISLPGIGPSTAAAIASLAFNQPTPILDGNVVRVLARYFMVDGSPELSVVKKKLWELAALCMTTHHCAEYTQAIMDLGATCCTLKNPHCQQCPLQNTCLAYRNAKVENYPFKKIKKIRPIKEQQFLLLHTQENQIYLEKRPPIGLWGGLWCLPVIDLNENPVEYIDKYYGLNCITLNKLLTFKHSFSHFHLQITALAMHIEPPVATVAENNGQWFNAVELKNVGLAKPVNQIISHFLS